MTVDAKQAVDAISSYFGSHRGSRALHAKGTLLKGTFTASDEARSLTRAAHMQGDPVPVTARLSNGSGNPDHPDYAPDPRGLAVKFYLPDGSRTDMVAVTTPRFVSRTPEGFVEMLAAQGSGIAAAWKLPAVFARHPEMLRNFPALAPSLRPPPSYGAVPYHGQHAFKWVDARGGERFVRYTWQPEASEAKISLREARARGRDYLSEELDRRLASGPIRFTLEVQLAASGDPTDDPSRAWPETRRRVRVGMLELTGHDNERETGGDVLVFDPTRVTDGIECSDDPVLLFRPKAYSESVARRTS
jgi:catalase